jgi:hypothetical protein
VTDPPPEEAAPSAEDLAERARRADRATKGALAAVLALEALVALLVPRAIAFTSTGLGTGRTIALITLAVLFLVAAGTVRRGVGIGLGSVLQIPFLLTGIWLLAMLVLAAIFAAIWVRVLLLRHELVGTPAGVRLFIS